MPSDRIEEDYHFLSTQTRTIPGLQRAVLQRMPQIHICHRIFGISRTKISKWNVNDIERRRGLCLTWVPFKAGLETAEDHEDMGQDTSLEAGLGHRPEKKLKSKSKNRVGSWRGRKGKDKRSRRTIGNGPHVRCQKLVLRRGESWELGDTGTNRWCLCRWHLTILLLSC